MEISKLSGLGSTSGRPASAQASDRHESDHQPETSGRGLVPIAPSQRESTSHLSTRPSPAFLAQLIATAQHAPQTRARRRIAPADAIARYGAVSVSAPTQTQNWDWSV
jgi:hypothetical protein